MSRALWSILNPNVYLRRIAPCTLLVFTDGWAEIALLRRAETGVFKLRSLGRVPRYRRTMRVRREALDPEESQGEKKREVRRGTRANCSLKDAKAQVEDLIAAIDVAAPEHVRVMRLPEVLVVTKLLVKWARITVLGIATSFALAWWLHQAAIIAVGLAAVVVGSIPYLAHAKGTLSLLGQDEVGVTPAMVHRYALAVERGELWGDALPPGTPVPPQTRVERVRQEYGRLRSDLVYRLECPALFDPAVATTAAFEAAMVAFEDEPSEVTAGRVELKFNLAREHAERVGFRHVDEGRREDVKRAAKVARSTPQPQDRTFPSAAP